MILLGKDGYDKLTEPIKKVTINNLFARSVIERRVTGRIYADNADDPRTFYVVHPYGMSLLFGDCNNAGFNETFRNYALNTDGIREKHEWMQAFPVNWNIVLGELFRDFIIRSADNTEKKAKGIIELNTRVNFRFNPKKYAEFRKKLVIRKHRIVRTDKHMFREMKGSVIPGLFWDSADDFQEKGVGFSLFLDQELVSTAYSAFIHDNKLELGIETAGNFRGNGFAQYACAALIDYCLGNKYEPVWACCLENRPSYHLAHKLGFEPMVVIPYYRLSN